MPDDPDYKPSAASNMWVHEPLPYTVRVRSHLGDDAVPSTQIFTGVMAYSAFEAIIQGITLAGGSGLDDMKHKVEEISPDVPNYVAIISSRAINQTLKSSK